MLFQFDVHMFGIHLLLELLKIMGRLLHLEEDELNSRREDFTAWHLLHSRCALLNCALWQQLQ